MVQDELVPEVSLLLWTELRGSGKLEALGARLVMYGSFKEDTGHLQHLQSGESHFGCRCVRAPFWRSCGRSQKPTGEYVHIFYEAEYSNVLISYAPYHLTSFFHANLDFYCSVCMLHVVLSKDKRWDVGDVVRIHPIS